MKVSERSSLIAVKQSINKVIPQMDAFLEGRNSWAADADKNMSHSPIHSSEHTPDIAVGTIDTLLRRYSKVYQFLHFYNEKSQK